MPTTTPTNALLSAAIEQLVELPHVADLPEPVRSICENIRTAARAQTYGPTAEATALLAAAPELRDMVADCADTLRRIIDQGWLDREDGAGAMTRLACHERIDHARTLLERLGGAR